MSFYKKTENFVCEHCGEFVSGAGYTNHCQKCLWSKHVDIEPGDRKAKCNGLMQPFSLRKKKGKWQVKQRCVKCGHVFWCKISPEDSIEEISKLLK
jgi:hypothetical protein